MTGQKKTRKKRRRGKPIKNKLKKFKVYYHNIRGIKSKLKSLKEIIEDEKPAVICITETHLGKEETIKIQDYKLFRNDRNTEGGGVLIGVHKKLKNVVLEASRSKDTDVEESIWVVMNNGKISVRIGCIYAPQESRTRVEKLDTMYKNLSKEIKTAEENNQKVFITGDFNCKVGDYIPDNKPVVTVGGKMLLNVIKKYKVKLLNSSTKCKGIWTRVEGNNKSVLDYIMVKKEDLDNCVDILIDEDRIVSPGGFNKNDTWMLSDHNPIVCNMKWVYEEKTEEKKRKKIITKKSLQKIQSEIKEKKVHEIWSYDNDLQTIYNIWSRKMGEIMEKHAITPKKKNRRKVLRLLYRAKRSVKIRRKKGGEVNFKVLKERESWLNEHIINEEKKQFRQKIGKVVDSLKSAGGNNGAMNVWDVIKRVKGKKKESPSAVYDKKGQLLEDTEEIKRRHEEYFSELLSPKESQTEVEREHEEFVNDYAEKIILIGELTTSRETTEDEIRKAMNNMKRKKCPDPEGWKNEIIIDGGEPMVKCLSLMLKKIGEEKKIPSQWCKILIRALNKSNVTTKMELKRGIFITNCISKVFEKIIKNRNKDSINKYVSPFQTGDKTHRSGIDTIMLTNATITKHRRLGKNTYLIFGDAVKCFDKLWLRSCIIELYRAGVDVSDIFFIYCLNKQSEVMIKTSVGDTSYIEVGETVKQGSILGPTIACLETDSVNRMGDEHVTSYSGNVGIGIPVHVDDISKAGDPVDAECTARKMKFMEDYRKFTFGLKKTKWMVIKTSRKKIVELQLNVSEGH